MVNLSWAIKQAHSQDIEMGCCQNIIIKAMAAKRPQVLRSQMGGLSPMPPGYAPAIKALFTQIQI